MDTFGTDLLSVAEQAYRSAVRDPTGCVDISELVVAARSRGSSEALVVALRAQAWCARQNLDAPAAKRLLDEAVRVARRNLLDGRLVEVLATRAAVSQELGKASSAQRDLDHARSLVSARNSADLDFQQAVLHQNSGRFTPAASLYQRLLDVASTPLDVRVKAANNLALIESQRGDHGNALARLDALRADAVTAGPALVAIVEDSRGWVTVQSGRLTDGLRILEQAAQKHLDAGLSLGEHYLEHCDALLDLRLLPEAMRMAELAQDVFAGHGVTLLAAEAKVRVARLAHLLGDDTVAAVAARSAGDMFRDQHRPAWAARSRVLEIEARARMQALSHNETRSLQRCAQSLEAAGMVSWAVDAYLAAGIRARDARRSRLAVACLTDAERLCRGGPALLRLRGHLAGAMHAEEMGESLKVQAHARAGLRDLADHRAALSSTELRTLASGHGEQLGQLGLRALLKEGTPGAILQGMERTRAAALLVTETLRVEGVEDSFDELRAVRDELAASRTETGAEPSELVMRLRTIEERIRRQTWSAPSRHSTAAAPVRLADLRRALSGRSLVEYATLDEDLVAIVFRRGRSRLVRLGPASAVDAHVDHLMFALRRLVRPSQAAATVLHAAASTSLQRLRELLLQPLALTPAEPLVIVPSVRHWRLPWTQLCAVPTSLAPSAAAWLRTVNRPAPAAGGVVLVAGPHLEGASAEVGALSKIHAGAELLIPPHSTVRAVVGKLKGARLAHLACHGRIRVDNPTFSAFQLSSGELTVHELDMHAVSPHRILLSACHSGADAVYDGGELLGFVSTLLGRGTAGLLASGIQVSDEESVQLMRNIHERLAKGDTLADALHHSSREVDERRPQGLATLCSFNVYGAA